MTQNSKQSQNNKTKSQSVTFTIAVMKRNKKNHINVVFCFKRTKLGIKF